MTLLCIKGNRSYGFVKNRVYPVVSKMKISDDTVSLCIQLTDRQMRLNLKVKETLFEGKAVLVSCSDPAQIVKFAIQTGEDE